MELKNTLLMPKGSFSMRANLAQKEPDMVKHFSDINLYSLILQKNEGRKPFYLHDGPPYANNEIHAGHALNKIVKDIIIKNKALEGYYTPYTPGWDTHGLPIENCVTKMGVDRRTTAPEVFRQKCREYALTQVDKQRNQILRLGVIGDYNNPYLTLNKDYEADQIRIFSKMILDGLIYKGLKPVNWSPSSESALAEAEIEYKDVKAKTIFVKFHVLDGKGKLNKEDSIVIWTTTPWTLPANQAVCLHPEFEYGLYKTNKGNLLFLTSLLETLTSKFDLKDVKLLKTFKGKELENITVSHPLLNKTSLVINDEYVSKDSGTGAVHIASGHGLDDYRICKKYGIDPFCPVDEKGYMTSDAGDNLKGLFYEDANDKVIEILKENNDLLALEEIVHSYPHDWRTKKPTIFRATSQWFCSISKIKDKVLNECEKVSYIPEWGKVRFSNMLSNRDDWCISRQRLWGVPIPIFYGEDLQPIIDKAVFDHIEKVFREQGSDVWYYKDAKELLPEGYTSIHSPNGIFTKEKDIMDVWFDSGSSFFSSDINLNHPFPADIYLEGNDQYRGWYNSSMILSVAYTGISPFKKIITHGFLVDQNGEKFSKSKQNGIDPVTICNNYGADILRLWTTTIDFTTAEIKLTKNLLTVCSEQYKKIRNTFKFMLTNLLDENEKYSIDFSYRPLTLSYMDKLMLNKLHSVTYEMKKAYDNYNLMQVNDILTNFIVNDLSGFYLDYSKDILYCESKKSIKRKNTQYVLLNIIHDLAIAFAPVLSFTMEEVYTFLPMKKKESILLEDYPLHNVSTKLLNDYKIIYNLKTNVNSILEPLRKETKEIGSSSEASVEYKASDEEREVISKIGLDNMKTILIVSSFTLADENRAYHHKGNRCDRCWNYFDNLEELESSHVCKRCLDAVKDFD